MWKWILRIAVAIGQSEWAKRKAKELIDKLRQKAEEKALELAAEHGLLPETDKK